MSDPRASFDSDIQGHLAGRQRKANELYADIEKARRGDAGDEEIAALTEKFLKFQTKLKEDIADLKNSVTPGTTLPDDAVRRVCKLLLHSVKGRCAPECKLVLTALANPKGVVALLGDTECGDGVAKKRGFREATRGGRRTNGPLFLRAGTSAPRP